MHSRMPPKVIQISDEKSPKSLYATKTIRIPTEDDIMLARLKAYSQIPIKNEPIAYLDADTIFLKNIEIKNYNPEKHYILPRTNDFIINPSWPEYYPEFVNKKAQDVMPYLFGAVITANPDLFEELYKICSALPRRFHRWYGDQVSLAIYAKRNKQIFELLDPKKNMLVLSGRITEEHIDSIMREDPQTITFKGPESKKYMQSTFKKLIKVKTKNGNHS